MEITPEYKIVLARKLRQRQTPSEAQLWQQLRGHGLDGLHFRRQRPIGRFVADFCCEQAKLIVEVDGAYHEEPMQRELDKEREAHFTGRGYTVLRVSASAVVTDCTSVLNDIRAAAAAAASAQHTQTSPLPKRGRGRGWGRDS